MINSPALDDARIDVAEVRLCGRTRGVFGESAVWSVADQGVWWVDLHGHSAILSRSDGRSHLWKTPGPKLPNPRAVMLRERGGLICALDDKLAAFEPDKGSFTILPVSLEVPAGHFFNDACVDAAGRVVIGTMAPGLGNDGRAVIYQIDRDLSVRILVEDLSTTNGLAFSPDGQTIYFSDSYQQVRKVWRATYDIATGRMGPPELFVDFANLPGRPDGAAVDEQGGYWIAGMGSPYLHRFTPEGELSLSMELPVDTPTRPAFGGEDLRTLYLTTGGLKNGELDDGLRGGLLQIPVDFTGILPNKCAM